MDKVSVIERYKREEDKLLVSKLFDKINLMERQNKIQVTDFLSPIELQIMKDVLKRIDFENYKVYGGIEDAQRNIVIIFPDKLKQLFEGDLFDYNSICNCIRITNVEGELDHRMYLGGLIKLGVKREKIGDIIVNKNGADIVVCKEIAKFLLNDLNSLTRFKNCNVQVIDLADITKKEQEFEEYKVIISSLRLDNIVAELARTSRNKATEILEQERVSINYRCETKATKTINCDDIVTIRGVGKFIITEFSGNTKSGKIVLLVKKYV